MIKLSRFFFVLAFLFTILYIPLGYVFISFSEAKVHFLHLFVSFSFITLIIHYLISGQINFFEKKYNNFSIYKMIKDPVNLFWLISILLFIGIVISTLFSTLPYVSFFGGSYDRNGYSSYDFLSFILLMWLVPHLFNNLTFIRWILVLIIFISLIACLYGFAEILGFSPIEFKNITDRVHSTFGNTINFSSFISMVIVITISTIFFERLSRWYFIVPVSVFIGVHLYMLWATASRGSWVGFVVSVLVFIYLFFWSKKFNQDYIQRFLFMILVSGISVLALSFTVERFTEGDILAGQDANDISSYRLLQSVSEISNTDRLDGKTDITGGLTGRFQIWGSSFSLLTSWDTPRSESTIFKIIRPIFGVGPDLFVYSFHFVVEPQTKLINVENAHNYYLNFLIELGILNLLIFSIFLLYLFFFGLKIINKSRKSDFTKNQDVFILIGIFAAIFGKSVEMIVGVPRIEDLSLLFLLMGILFVIYQINYKNELSEKFVQSTTNNQIFTRDTNSKISGKKLLVFIIVGAVIFGLISVNYWDIKRMYASNLAARAIKLTDSDQRFDLLKRATELAPGHESIIINHIKPILIQAKLESDKGNIQEAILLTEMAREILLRFEKIDPYEWDIQLALVVVLNTLYDFGLEEYADEAKFRNIYVANQYPGYPKILSLSSLALLKMGDVLNAELIANDVMKMEATTKPFVDVWYVKGLILYNLGYLDESIEIFNSAISKEDLGEGAVLSHLMLSKIYLEKFDDKQKSEFHSDQAMKVNEITAIWALANEENLKNAQYRLGLLYQFGDFFETDLSLASLWYQRAALQGHIYAMNNLANLATERGDFINALKWYELAADSGDPRAQYNLALFKEEKNSSLNEALKLYKLSADQGLPDSQYKLGLKYRIGIGVPKNQKLAFQLFLNAAEQGYDLAFFQLFEMYKFGEGVEIDDEQSEIWYQKWEDINRSKN